MYTYVCVCVCVCVCCVCVLGKVVDVFYGDCIWYLFLYGKWKSPVAMGK